MLVSKCNVTNLEDHLQSIISRDRTKGLTLCSQAEHMERGRQSHGV